MLLWSVELPDRTYDSIRDEKMRFGFIGTGGITEAIIHGIHCKPNLEFPIDAINVSKRNAERSARLTSRYNNVSTFESNQHLVDQSDWVFVAVLPNQAKPVFELLEFRPGQQLISLVAGVSVSKLREWSGHVDVVRIIPLPPVEIGMGPIPIHPPNKPVERFLNQIGSAVSIDEEDQFSAFSAASAIMATYFEFTSSVAKWIRRQGVSEQASAVYSTTMLRALAETAKQKSFGELIEMSDECLTPGGLNEQILFNKRKSHWFDSIDSNFDQIMQRIR